MKKLIMIVVSGFVLIATSQVMAGIVVNTTVSGNACPYFAGQSFPVPIAATGDDPLYHLDWFDAGTMPPWIDITGFGGTILSITAFGEWSHGPVPSGPDGYADFDPTHQEYTDLGISPVINTPLNTLIGVFLADVAPVAFSAPPSLTFGVSDMTSPVLQQTFVIGSNLNNITIPSGATRLFFGLNDGYEWTNNWGSVGVTVSPIPAPGAILLGSIGVGLVSWLRRRRTL